MWLSDLANISTIFGVVLALITTAIAVIGYVSVRRIWPQIRDVYSGDREYEESSHIERSTVRGSVVNAKAEGEGTVNVYAGDYPTTSSSAEIDN